MSLKTMFFWYAVVVALAVIGSSVALPVETIDIIPVSNKEQPILNKDVEEQSSPEELKPNTESTDGTDILFLNEQKKEQQQEPQQQKTDQTIVGSEFPVTNTATSDVQQNVNTESNSADTAKPVENVSGSIPPSFTVSESESQTTDVPKKPQFTDNVHTVKFNPFFMEFFQPFQPIQPFQPFHANPNPNYETQSFRYPQLSFGSSVNSFDPFTNFMQSPSFYHPVNAYANIFRTPKTIIVKRKRNVRPNITSIPPIQLLLNNIMLNAFRRKPTDMLETLDKSMMQMENTGNSQNVQIGSEKPVPKTTTKTEIIDGHLVQINETTYSNGDANHKSFYHIKEIKVLPENQNKKIDNEKVISMTNDEVESEKIETNEIKHDPFETIVIADAVADNNKNSMEKNSGPVPLTDHFQTAASSYYTPYAPYHSRPATLFNYHQPPLNTDFPSPMTVNYGWLSMPPQYVNFGRPPPMVNYGRPPQMVNFGRPSLMGNYGRPPPISLHNDILVNELAAAQQQASGVNAVLPPDVEVVDFSKPQKGPKKYQAQILL